MHVHESQTHAHIPVLLDYFTHNLSAIHFFLQIYSEWCRGSAACDFFSALHNTAPSRQRQVMFVHRTGAGGDMRKVSQP